MTYASFWKRTAAYLVDGFIYGVILHGTNLVLGIIFALVLGNTNGQNPVAELALLAISLFLSAGIYIAYYVCPESSSWQATIGKKLFKLKVTDTNGQRISFWRSLGRNLGRIISFIILCIGYLMCFWTEKKQCLHDQMADCLVVDETPNEKQGCVIGVFVCFLILGLFVPLIVGVLAAMALPQYFKAVEKSRAAEVMTLLIPLAHSQQRYYLKMDRFAQAFDQLDIAPAGAFGNTFYTKGDPATGANGNGFRIQLSLDTSYKNGHAIAQRVQDGNENKQFSYSLTRYYSSTNTACTGYNLNGAAFCADACGVNHLDVGQTCCMNGTVGNCPRNEPR